MARVRCSSLHYGPLGARGIGSATSTRMSAVARPHIKPNSIAMSAFGSRQRRNERNPNTSALRPRRTYRRAAPTEAMGEFGQYAAANEHQRRPRTSEIRRVSPGRIRGSAAAATPPQARRRNSASRGRGALTSTAMLPGLCRLVRMAAGWTLTARAGVAGHSRDFGVVAHLRAYLWGLSRGFRASADGNERTEGGMLRSLGDPCSQALGNERYQRAVCTIAL